MRFLRISVRIAPHKRREFELAARDLIGTGLPAAGWISQSFSRDLQEEGVFWYTETWENPSAMESHMTSTKFRALIGAMKVLGEVLEAQLITSDRVDQFEPALEGQ